MDINRTGQGKNMRGTMSKASALVVFAIATFSGASSAWADFISFSASNGSGLSASVSFETSGGNLIVTLTNTSAMDVTVPSQVLTAVFFSLPGSMTPVSAVLNSGSVVNGDSAPAGGAVGGEWAYQSGLNVGGSNSGISSSGLGIFGPGNLFGGPDLDSPVSPNGLNYGITSAGDNPASGNGGLSGEPLIQNSVVFTLSGWNANWSLSQIANVFFQYGTSLSEPHLGAVPEPGVLALLGIGLAGLVFGARRMSWA